MVKKNKTDEIYDAIFKKSKGARGHAQIKRDRKHAIERATRKKTK